MDEYDRVRDNWRRVYNQPCPKKKGLPPVLIVFLVLLLVFVASRFLSSMQLPNNTVPTRPAQNQNNVN